MRFVFQRVINVSISDTLYPEIPDALLKHHAEIPARTTPARVPSVAAHVFRVGPPIRYMVTSVVIKHKTLRSKTVSISDTQAADIQKSRRKT